MPTYPASVLLPMTLLVTSLSVRRYRVMTLLVTNYDVACYLFADFIREIRLFTPTSTPTEG